MSVKKKKKKWYIPTNGLISILNRVKHLQTFTMIGSEVKGVNDD